MNSVPCSSGAKPNGNFAGTAGESGIFGRVSGAIRCGRMANEVESVIKDRRNNPLEWIDDYLIFGIIYRTNIMTDGKSRRERLATEQWDQIISNQLRRPMVKN